jgi:hypothetical protein
LNPSVSLSVQKKKTVGLATLLGIILHGVCVKYFRLSHDIEHYASGGGGGEGGGGYIVRGIEVNIRILAAKIGIPLFVKVVAIGSYFVVLSY